LRLFRRTVNKLMALAFATGFMPRFAGRRLLGERRSAACVTGTGAIPRRWTESTYQDGFGRHALPANGRLPFRAFLCL